MFYNPENRQPQTPFPTVKDSVCGDVRARMWGTLESERRAAHGNGMGKKKIRKVRRNRWRSLGKGEARAQDEENILGRGT